MRIGDVGVDEGEGAAVAGYAREATSDRSDGAAGNESAKRSFVKNQLRPNNEIWVLT